MPRTRTVALFVIVVGIFVVCGCATSSKTVDYQPEVVCPEPESVEWDTAPKVSHFAKPVYPEIARRKQIEGTVDVTVWVSEDGKVFDAAICVSSGSSHLDASAIQAAWKCIFYPAMKAGVAVRSTARIPFNFRLN